MTGYHEQKPWDRSGYRSIHPGGDARRDLAAVLVVPGGTRKVGPYGFVILVVKLGIWRLQHPARLAVGIWPADIDLETRGMRHANQLFVRRRLDQTWDIWLFHGGDSSIRDSSSAFYGPLAGTVAGAPEQYFALFSLFFMPRKALKSRRKEISVDE
jgi:hypothetical protein